MVGQSVNACIAQIQLKPQQENHSFASEIEYHNTDTFIVLIIFEPFIQYPAYPLSTHSAIFSCLTDFQKSGSYVNWNNT